MLRYIRQLKTHADINQVTTSGQPYTLAFGTTSFHYTLYHTEDKCDSYLRVNGNQSFARLTTVHTFSAIGGQSR